MDEAQLYKRFPTQKDCLMYLEALRWQGEPKCPYCNSLRVTLLPKESRFHCNACNTSFSPMVRTIFHKTKIDLQRWFLAIALVLNAEKAISARQLAQKIKVNKNTGWFMLMRIRNAMREQREFIEKIINADDVYAKGKTNHSFNY